jgi:small-conductance mechanosensitive channel
VVESIQLRTLTLRDVHGTVHVFPNGSITTLANQSKDFAYAVLDVSVAYKADLDVVYEALRAADADLRADPTYHDVILEPLEIFGVDALAESGVTIRMRSKTVPLRQFEVARALRRRIKQEFDARGIEIPFPQRTVHVVDR